MTKRVVLAAGVVLGVLLGLMSRPREPQPLDPHGTWTKWRDG